MNPLSCLMQHRRFDPPPGRIFPLELTWVLTPFPQNSFGWEYKPRYSVCTHAFHRTDSKDPHIHVLDGWMLATKIHPACTIHEDEMRVTSTVGLKNSHIYIIFKNLTQAGEPQRYSLDHRRRRRRIYFICCAYQPSHLLSTMTTSRKSLYNSKAMAEM